MSAQLFVLYVYILYTCLSILLYLHQPFQLLPTPDGVVPVHPYGAAHFVTAAGLAQVALGEELVGIADDFLLQALRAIIAWRDG